VTAVLADTTWDQVPTRPIVLVPLGSTEQHGPHLPFATDAVIASAVAQAAAPAIEAALRHPTLVAPTVPFGASGEHQDFPGTVSIGHEALHAVLVAMIRSLSTWADRIVLVNGHGGNIPTVTAVIRQMTHERHQVSAVMCALETPTDAHAGYDETCVLLHLQPETVRMAAASPGNTSPLREILPALMSSGVRPVSPSGILGDPTMATAEAGSILYAQLVSTVVAQVTRD
jgi:mycofactocin precursor peptide peptidase